MIDVHVLVKAEELTEFRVMFNSWDFFAKYSSETISGADKRWLYIVRTTSEMYMYLRLKYGNDNVWKR